MTPADPFDFTTDDVLDEMLQDGLDQAGPGDETAYNPGARALRRRPTRRAYRRIRATEDLAACLGDPPAPGESIHILSGGRFSCWDFVPVLIDKAGPADRLYVSTWTVGRENVLELMDLMDAKKIKAASFVVDMSFKRRKTDIYAILYAGLRDRGGRYRALANHAKLLIVDAGGLPFVVETSANLTTNPRLESYVCSHDAELFDFHRRWMEDVFEKSAAQRNREDYAPPTGRKGYHNRRAGLGTLTWTNNPGERRRLLAAKLNPLADDKHLADFAAAIVEMVGDALPALPLRTIVTTPPQGASWPGPYYAETLAREVAGQLRVPYRPILERKEAKTRHGLQASLSQAAFAVKPDALDDLDAVLLVDDAVTTGRTMRLSVEALRTAGLAAYGFAYSGS